MSASRWPDELQLHRIKQDARMHGNAFFEKLALLDGGTVALVITAVLGPLHGVVRYRLLLSSGLGCLVVAMLVLLWRNFQGGIFELISVKITSHWPNGHQHFGKLEEEVSTKILYSERIGAALSAIGIVLLLAEVLLILNCQAIASPPDAIVPL